MNDIHIGSLIRKKMNEKELRAIDFAKALHCNRSNIYSIFERKNVDLELLTMISKVLDYDFLALYHENKDRQQHYKITLETNATKMRDLLSDDLIRIIELQEMSK
jgi:transcriptional regulator with XRE-family HTH domain